MDRTLRFLLKQNLAQKEEEEERKRLLEEEEYERRMPVLNRRVRDDLPLTPACRPPKDETKSKRKRRGRKSFLNYLQLALLTCRNQNIILDDSGYMFMRQFSWLLDFLFFYVKVGPDPRSILVVSRCSPSECGHYFTSPCLWLFSCLSVA